jgi:D-arabinitol dehydrogenase (NADP+)
LETGLILSQILKLNGAAKVVIAANKGIKTDIARQLDAADEYVEIDREAPDAQWAQLKKDYPYGFDAVVRPHFLTPARSSSFLGRSNWLRESR